jgi:hypothetical protein
MFWGGEGVEEPPEPAAWYAAATLRTLNGAVDNSTTHRRWWHMVVFPSTEGSSGYHFYTRGMYMEIMHRSMCVTYMPSPETHYP